jgi:hypothetical protein
MLDRLDDQPFKPFRLHISDGTAIAVVDPGMVIVGESSVVIPSSFTRDEEGRRLAKHWRTIALNHIVQFSALDEPVNGKGKKKKS